VIGFLRGKIIDRASETLILDVSGVGYELTCSLNTLDDFALTADVQIFVHTHVREDAINLFGFSSLLEKQMFLSLMKVNGVGPKMAVKILSSAPLPRLLEMIEAGDVKGLSTLPKVGKKTAEQLILTLRGKLVLEDTAPSAVAGSVARKPKVKEEITSALVNLGFRLPEVEKVVAAIAPDLDLQQGIRQGLQALSGQL
jgi:Holliday junction DNA helicase RuvA